jgi:hypothetical protein
MLDLDKLKQLTNENKLTVGLLVLVVIASSASVVFLMYDQGPQVPEEKQFSSGIIYEYDTVTFDYGYAGPDPEESDETLPKRAIIHKTDEINEETRIHEFNPTYDEAEQSYTIDLKEIAEDPEDHLRTHPKINLTIIYDNGARETVASTVEPENISDVLYINYISRETGNGSLQIDFSDISAEKAVVEAPNNTYTVEERSQITITPDDYYQDTTGDGVYDTSGSVVIKKQYKDVSQEVDTLNPTVDTPSISTGDSNRDGHFTVSMGSTQYDSLTVETPGGEYIQEKHYNLQTEQYEGDLNTYLQTVEGVKDTRGTPLTIKDDAEEVKVYVEIDGETYLLRTLENPN